MNMPNNSGNAPFVLSVLDNAFTGVGHTVENTFQEMIALAKLADKRGFQRFWMSEHHAMPGAAVPSPQMMVARLTGETERIRLGAGGIMLPNHVPLVVAEQFGILMRWRQDGLIWVWEGHQVRMAQQLQLCVVTMRQTMSFLSKSQSCWVF